VRALGGLLVLISACHVDEPAIDAAFPDAAEEEDAAPVDTGEFDSGPQDAGPLPALPNRISEIACADCANGCSGENCLRAQTGESFCSDRCDDDLEACPEGFTCFDISGGADPQWFCVPPAATCAPSVGWGQRCIGNADACAPIANHCEGDFHNFGYCTTVCTDPRECPAGFECAPGDEGGNVCRATYVAPAEMCARGNDGTEIPCAVDTDCGGLPGSICVRSDLTLPGVCAVECGSSCGDLACLPTERGEVCLSDRCGCHALRAPDGSRDLLEEALSQVGLTPCSVLFDIYGWTLAPPDVLLDPYRFGFYSSVHNEPLRAPGFAKDLLAELDAIAEASDHPARRAARMVERLSELADQPAVLQAPGNIDVAEPLVQAVADLITLAGGSPNLNQLRADASDVPPDLQLAVATVIEGMSRAYSARVNAIGRGPVIDQIYLYGAAFVAPRRDSFGFNPADDGTRLLLTEQFGYDDMYGGAVDLLDAIADADLDRFAAIPTSTTATVATFLFSQPTPVGRIAIGDGESGIYDPRILTQGVEWALLVDLGGDDDYLINAGGNASADNTVSVMIDLDGADEYGYVEVPNLLDGDRLPSDAGGRYSPAAGPDMDNGPISYSEVPRQGSGRMGTGVLIDLGGDRDRYRSLRMSQGSGIFGTGVLVDDGGDDIYLAEAMAQGAGSFGIGVQLDLGGNDRRESYTESQGFAFAKAIGLAYDTSGDDQWLMDVGDPAAGGDPLYFNSQRAGRANSTLGQGFGFGRRADLPPVADRAFMSGGVGILVDGDGIDRYEGSIFAQGGGFWFGTGILADRGGDDSYDALWYGMATGAHYATSFLLDGGGNDTYGGVFPRVNITIAGAHDFSTTFLIDESGDDTYSASRISLGSGNSNGIGFFVDNAGSDHYDVRSRYAIGSAGLFNEMPGSAKRKVNSIGVFLDAAGTDLYTLETMPLAGFGDDMIWRGTNNEDPAVQAVELGTGVDGTGESTLHYP
jgi:hypothetical protein